MAQQKVASDSERYNEIADCVCEMLEVWTHQVLYTRDVYPTQAFKRCLKYNTPVQMCIHPDVTKYVRSCLKPVNAALREPGCLQEVAVCIRDNEDDAECVERYVIEFLSQSPSSPATYHQGDSSSNRAEDLSIIQQQLRSVLLSLASNVPAKRRLSDDATFTIQAKLHSVKGRTMSRSMCEDVGFPWMSQYEPPHHEHPSSPSPPHHTSRRPQRVSLLPLLHVTLPAHFKLQMYVETIDDHPPPDL